jgi:O-antigen ligase
MQRVPPELFGDFLSRLLTLLQILVFFWIASDLLKDEKLARGVLLTYSFACALLAVGMVLGLPGFSQEVTGGRVSAIGENLNVLGKFMAIAMIIVMHLSARGVYSGFRKVLLASLTLPIAVAMIQTGSRGAVAAFVIGTCVYLLPYYKTKRGMLAVILAICGLAGVVYMMVKSPDFLGRWQESYYEGKLSERENIFAATIEMISEQPLFGWGPIEPGYELGFRGGSWEPNDTHNLLLHLLVEVGITGTIPFLIGLWLCLRSAWSARLSTLGLLPLALLVMALAGSLSGNSLVWKPQWLILALAVATASDLTAKVVRSVDAARVTTSQKRGTLDSLDTV